MKRLITNNNRNSALYMSGSIVLSSIMYRVFLNDVPKNQKYSTGFFLGAGVLKLSKDKIYRDLGRGLFLSSAINWMYDLTRKSNCPFVFKSNLPTENSILININNGNIIQKICPKNGIIYLTKSNNREGWLESFKLLHCLNISGRYGGLPSKKGNPVLWHKLQNHTIEFNYLLRSWINYFESKRKIFEDKNNSYEKKLDFWRSMVNDGKPLDIKNKDWKPKFKGEWSVYNNTLLRYDDYGNILYGAAGAAFGLDKFTLIVGANLNQITKTGFDDEKDTKSILRGIRLYQDFLKASVPNFIK